MKPLPKPQVEEIINLHLSGNRITEISTETGINYHTVRGIIYKRFGGKKRLPKDEVEKLKKNIIEARKTMTISAVAKKYDRTRRYVLHVCSDHPDRSQFIGAKVRKKKQSNPNADAKLFRGDGMEKGHIKLKREEKVMPTKIYDPKQQRSVPLNDGKNTLIFVNINDTRSNDEVRRAFIEKNEREYKALKVWKKGGGEND